MRYVDHDQLKFPDGWLDRAQVATNAVAGGADPNNSANLWHELKDYLAALLPDKKCWYCETPADRSDNAVDHFRPKGRVSDAASHHEGYRWLAFDWRNYRYACTFCNSRRKDVVNGTAGGKADRFPLLDETKRLYGPGLLRQEKPALLDPCNLHDWELLGCKRESGKPCATSDDATKKQRADISIEIYHLDYQPTCNRRHATAVQMMADIDQAKNLFEQIENDPTKEEDFFGVAKKIKRAIDKESPYSGEMIFLLKGQRSAKHWWIQQLLET